jgi:hypothetical protein
MRIQEDEGSSKDSFHDMKITPGLFEAYLKCPTKCWLRATGERSAGNTYSEWVKAQNDSYRLTGTSRLVAAFRNDEVVFSPDVENFKVAKWQLALNFAARAQMDCCALESEIHALRRMPVVCRQEDPNHGFGLGFTTFRISSTMASVDLPPPRDANFRRE